MLRDFRISDDVAVRVHPDTLRETVKAIFMKLGVPEADAGWGAEVLVYADLRGVDTHGVSGPLAGYVRGLSIGAANPRPNWKVVRETASTATVDGDGGIGTLILGPIMELVIEKARKAGSCGISVRNSGHAGPIGYFALQAAKQDMLGVAYTSAGNLVLPTFAAEGRYGTNPIAFAAPAGEEPPFVFDAATSAIASGKIGLARRLGSLLQPGWVAKDDGSPDMAGGRAPAELEGQRRGQLPLGSTRELGSHKGYGLAMMAEIMTGPLSAAIGYREGLDSRRAHHVQAWDIEGFCDLGEFKADMDGILRRLRETRPAPGESRVLYAGLPEAETEIERTKNGVPLHPETVEWFRSTCAELGVHDALS